MPLLTLLVGASGGGKSTLLNALKEYYCGERAQIVPGKTTRSRRPGENDEEYEFVPHPYVATLVEGDLTWRIEPIYRQVNITQRTEVEGAFTDTDLAFMIISQKGLIRVQCGCRSIGIDTLPIYLQLPNDEAEVERRLQERGDNGDAIKQRIELDRRREANGLAFARVYGMHIIPPLSCEDTLAEAVRLIEAFRQRRS